MRNKRPPISYLNTAAQQLLKIASVPRLRAFEGTAYGKAVVGERHGEMPKHMNEMDVGCSWVQSRVGTSSSSRGKDHVLSVSNTCGRIVVLPKKLCGLFEKQTTFLLLL